MRERVRFLECRQSPKNPSDPGEREEVKGEVGKETMRGEKAESQNGTLHELKIFKRIFPFPERVAGEKALRKLGGKRK